MANQNLFIPYTNLGFTVSLGETAIGDIKQISGLNITAEEVETTAITEADGFKRWAALLKDVGELTITAYTTKATKDTVVAKMLDVSTSDEGFYTDLTLTFPARATAGLDGFTFAGFVKSIKDSDYVSNDIQTIDIVFRPSGKPTVNKVTAGE